MKRVTSKRELERIADIVEYTNSCPRKSIWEAYSRPSERKVGIYCRYSCVLSDCSVYTANPFIFTMVGSWVASTYM